MKLLLSSRAGLLMGGALKARRYSAMSIPFATGMFPPRFERCRGRRGSTAPTAFLVTVNFRPVSFSLSDELGWSAGRDLNCTCGRVCFAARAASGRRKDAAFGDDDDFLGGGRGLPNLRFFDGESLGVSAEGVVFFGTSL